MQYESIGLAIQSALTVALPTFLLAVLVERTLKRLGLCRGNLSGLLIGGAFWLLVSIMMATQPGHWLLGIVIGFVIPISANRYDLTRTIYEGRRWWERATPQRKV